MSETTDFLGLVKPGGGSTGLITPPDRVDIDVLNDNFQKIDDWAETIGGRTNRLINFRGPAGSLGALSGMVRGDTYQETDGALWRWEYDGSNWVSARNGMYMIRPASVVGGSLSSDDGVVPNAGATSMSVNGIFSSRFRFYKIIFCFRASGAGGGLWWRYRRAGADLAANSHLFSRVYNSSAGGPPGANSGTLTYLDSTAAPGDLLMGEATIANPGNNGAVSFISKAQASAGSLMMLTEFGAVSTGENVAPFDGITCLLSSNAFAAGNENFMKIYGLA